MAANDEQLQLQIKLVSIILGSLLFSILLTSLEALKDEDSFHPLVWTGLGEETLGELGWQSE